MTTMTTHPHTTFGGVRPVFAGAPAEIRAGARDDVRLLVARRHSISHRSFAAITDELSPGDVLVVNTSATVNGETDATWHSSHGAQDVVLHVAELGGHEWVVELRSAPDAARPILEARPGEHVTAPGVGDFHIEAPYPHQGSPNGKGNRLWHATSRDHVRRGLDNWGRPIAYGYLDSRWSLATYQTVFSRVPGSAEMASAGSPFTQDLVLSLVTRGIAFAPVVLHTGFSSQEAGEPPQPERFEVPAHTAAIVNDARARGARVVAVGTTATRALESAVGEDGRVGPDAGWTDRVVTPDSPPQVVNGLITGWHDEDASHLLLVEAVVGAGLSQHAYDAALAHGYTWHEFGDSCLFLP